MFGRWRPGRSSRGCDNPGLPRARGQRPRAQARRGENHGREGRRGSSGPGGGSRGVLVRQEQGGSREEQHGAEAGAWEAPGSWVAATARKGQRRWLKAREKDRERERRESDTC